jgi:hypothetical protein
MSSPFEAAIYDLLAARSPGKSICPSEVAKRVDPENWRRHLGQVRAEAVGLARAERLVITRHNKPVDPNAFKGVYRLKLPPTEENPSA